MLPARFDQSVIIGQIQVRQLRVSQDVCSRIPHMDDSGLCSYVYDHSVDRGRHNGTGRASGDGEDLWYFRDSAGDHLEPGMWGQTQWYQAAGLVVQLNVSQ